PANAFGSRPPEEIRVIGAENQFAGIFIDPVVYRTASQVWQCQQAGYIGVIHELDISKTICFVNIYLTMTGMFNHTIFPDSFLHFTGQSLTFFSEGIV